MSVAGHVRYCEHGVAWGCEPCQAVQYGLWVEFWASMGVSERDAPRAGQAVTDRGFEYERPAQMADIKGRQ